MSRAPLRLALAGFGLCAGALLLPAAATAIDESPRHADDAVRSAWAKAIRQAHACDVRHFEDRAHPVTFTTIMPCELLEHVSYANGTLVWDGTDPIAEQLASVVEGPVMSGSEPPACEDSTGGDEITLGFGSGKKGLTLTFNPLAGTLQVEDGKDHDEFYDLDRGTGDLLTRLAHYIPSDARLAQITPCPGRISALGVAATLAGVTSLGAVDVFPKARKKVKPKFPEDAKGPEAEGTVVVRALVDTLGHVTRTRIAESNPAFDRNAVLAVEQWEFEPGRVDGHPVAVWVAVPVKFRQTN